MGAVCIHTLYYHMVLCATYGDMMYYMRFWCTLYMYTACIPTPLSLSLSLPEWRQFVYMGYEVILASQKMQPSNDRTRVQCNIIAGVDMYIDWRQCIFNSATLSSRVADGSGLLLCSFYICV